MKKPDKTPSDVDTMRPEYDFSKGKRGTTHMRYRAGTNLVLIDTDVLDVFPDATAVNEALKALAPMLRHRRKGRTSA